MSLYSVRKSLQIYKEFYIRSKKIRKKIKKFETFFYLVVFQIVISSKICHFYLKKR